MRRLAVIAQEEQKVGSFHTEFDWEGSVKFPNPNMFTGSSFLTGFVVPNQQLN